MMYLRVLPSTVEHFSSRKRSRIRGVKLISTVAFGAFLSGPSAQASNWIWTNARGDGSWSATGNNTTNWINLYQGTTTTIPGTGANTGANAVFADDVLSNLSPYTIAGIPSGGSGTITIPSLVAVPTTGLTVGGLSFGDNEPAGTGTSTGAGSLQLSTTFTLGSSASTITVGSGGIERENGTGTLLATTGVQTIASNLTLLSTQTNEPWAIGGGGGELLITGNLTSTAAQTISKSAGGVLEIASNNSASYQGAFILQGGTTILDSAYSLGAGTASIAVGGVGSTVTSGASLLIGPGVAYTTAVSTVASAHNPSITLGGNSGTNSWAGAIVMNAGTLNQGITLSGGGTFSDVTTFTGVISDGTLGVAANDPVTKTGAATVILQGHSTFGGVYTNRGGTTVIGVPDALGTGTSAVLDSGATSTNLASLLSADGVTFTRNVVVQSGTGTTQYGATLGGYQIATTSTWTGAIALNQNASLTGGNAGTVNFSGSISDGTTNFVGSAITKTGAGIVELSGTNTYSGATTVTAGTLLLASTGALQGTGGVSVGSSSFFGGAGSVAGLVAVSAGGTLFEGNSNIGSLTAGGGVTLASGATLQIKLQAPTAASPAEGTDNDVVTLQGSGTVFSPAGATLQLLPAYNTFTSATFAKGPVTYVIVDGGAGNTIDPTTTFANLANGAVYTDGSSTYSVNYLNNEITLTLSSVPEPVGSGLIILAAPLLKRRRRQTAAKV